MMKIPNLPQAKLKFLPCAGGLDQVTPILRTKPGTCAAAENFEIGINGGYDTVSGYERFDGQSAPSSASYYLVSVNITGSFSINDVITGQSSGATATVAYVGADYLVFTQKASQSGTFSNPENLLVSAVVEGATTSDAMLSGASTPKLHAQYKNYAADVLRSDIAAVTGSGDILGLWRLGGVQYAVRNNAGGTAAVIYKSSSSGWTAVSLGFELSFTSGGTYVISEGDTITGATSGATASVTRVVLESGSFSGGDAAGRLIFASQTGTFQAENLDVGANLNVATIAADSSAITLSPSGRFETVKHNFGGTSGTERIYGVDGVNRGFEFDGTVFVPIETGVATDTPLHVAVHKFHLFFSYESSAQHSGIGTPYIWSPVFGAGELAVGDTITGMKAEEGAQGESALLIYSRNSSHVLYGTSSADWNLVRYRDEVGAFPYTIQQLSITLMMDDRGITNLQTSQAYGNFKHSSFSNQVQPFIVSRKSIITASCICREKNQYRLFFSDKYALYVTMEGNKLVGIMPQNFLHDATCTSSDEDSDGTEVIMFGSSDGYVYQMEKGTSFDGGDINFYFRLHYSNLGSPRILKGFKDCSVEVSGEGYTEAKFTFEVDYSSKYRSQPTQVQTEELDLFASRWDSFTWDNFYWDSVDLSIIDFDLGGSGENISMIFRGNGDYFSTLKISGVTVRYLTRRLKR